MKSIHAILASIQNLNRKEIFLLGFYVSFLVIMTLAMIIDYHIGNITDAWIEAIMVALTALNFLWYRYTGNVRMAMYGIVLLSTVTSYTYILSNAYTVSIFHAIVPLGYFLLFSLRVSLVLTAIHESAVVVLYGVNYHYHPEYMVYHHPEIVTASILASLLVIFFGIVYHIAIENSYQKLAQSDHQKELLLKEVHHRVKNNLNIVSSMLGLQMLREHDEYVKDILMKNRHRIRSIAMVHEILYRHDDFERIHAHEYLRQLAATLIDVYDREVKVAVEGIEIEMPFELALRIGIIANELITNSIKYALGGDAPFIRMRLDQEKTHYIFFYTDSHSTPVDRADIQAHKSLGLRFIDMMVAQLDADLTVRSDAGLVYTLWIPKYVH